MQRYSGRLPLDMVGQRRPKEIASVADRANVVVVDARPLFRQGVASALTSTRSFSIIDQGTTADDAEMLVTKHKPDVLVMGADWSNEGLECVERIKAASPTTRVMVLTTLQDRQHIEEAFRAGVSGYLLKDVQASELCQAASAIVEGEVFVCKKLINRLLQVAEVSPLEIAFSEREEQVLQLLCLGKSNKTIAYELSISEKTVKHYLTALMKKLNARNRVEVALFAARRNNSSRRRQEVPDRAQADPRASSAFG